MTIHYDELINLLAELCEDKNLQAAVTGSLRGGTIAGASAILGGLLLGPVGLALGGTVGSIAAATTAKGKFRPVAQILIELSPTKKKELFQRWKNAFKDFDVTDLLSLRYLLLSNKSLQELAIREVTNFLQGNLSMAVRSG